MGNFKRRGRKSIPDQCICTADRKDAAATCDSMRNLQGTNRAHFVDRREFEYLFKNRWKQRISMFLKNQYGNDDKGMYRQDVYELPTDSIRELIANAVAHRSYLEPGNIQVALFGDRLEITSRECF